jgi:predicted MFS family arabinose efflux permease
VSGQSYSGGYKGWVLALCFLMMASNYIDRSIVVILAQPIKDEFHLSDFELGALGGLAFAVLFIVAGFPLARLAERRSRVAIISASIAVWSAMTALCGIAQSYVQLLLCRVGVGIGEAGASPAAQSLLADYYPPQRRASALSVFALGGPIGGLFGAIVAGMVAQTYGWRAAFFVVGLPGLLLAILFWLTADEPSRGAQDSPVSAAAAATGVVPSMWDAVRCLFGSRTFVHMAIGAAVANFAVQGILQFTAANFVRRFDIGLGEAGLVMGVVGGLCGGLGTLAGGFGSDRAARVDARWYAWLPAVSLAAAAPLYVVAFVQKSWPASAAMLVLPSIFTYVFLAPLLSVTQNLVGARMRATAVALLTLVTASIGVALGPITVGWLSDQLAAASFAATKLGEFAVLCGNGTLAAAAADPARQACRAASAAGVQQAIIASTAFFLWAAAHFHVASGTIRRDLAHAAAHNHASTTPQPPPLAAA